MTETIKPEALETSAPNLSTNSADVFLRDCLCIHLETTSDQTHITLNALLPGSGRTASLKKIDHIELFNAVGITVARIARKSFDTWSKRIDKIRRISIVAVIERRIEEVDEKYGANCRCKKWAVPIVEIIWS